MVYACVMTEPSVMATTSMGRRERKKAQTRRALADAAMKLFVERGFDAVTVAEVAETADVSISTLFKHFPSKEALVFADGDRIGTDLVLAVADRAPGTPLLHALRDAMINGPDGEVAGPTPESVQLVEQTPTLAAYLERLWARSARTLADAIAADGDRDPHDPQVRALARYALLVPSIARKASDPAQAIRDVFALLENGWPTAS